jgi:hypothetical protein
VGGIFVPGLTASLASSSRLNTWMEGREGKEKLARDRLLRRFARIILGTPSKVFSRMGSVITKPIDLLKDQGPD